MLPGIELSRPPPPAPANQTLTLGQDLCFQSESPNEYIAFSCWSGEQRVESGLKRESSKILTIEEVRNVTIWQKKKRCQGTDKVELCLSVVLDAKQWE